MQSIEQIFNDGFSSQNDNIIKFVKVDYKRHLEGILNIAKHLEPDFKLNEVNEKVIKKLLYYFTGDSACEISLKKGIMLVGDVGTGKTFIFRVFKHYTSVINRLNSYQVHTSKDIIDKINSNGAEYYDLFSHNNNRPIVCYIDDIASRNEKIKHFGTEIDVIEQLISTRYEVYSRYRKLTHVSSNKYPEDLMNIYDIRIVDRMKEMFNIIELSGESFRN